MSAAVPLVRLVPEDIRVAWPDEAANFTPWRADNLDLLREALGLDLDIEGIEVEVGSFAADILACDGGGRPVVVENQCVKTDHRHLGHILTYMGGLDARIAVWVAPEFCGEHRATIDFLNRAAIQDYAVFGVRIRLFRAGDARAPMLEVVARPNDWVRASGRALRAAEEGAQRERWRQYWQSVLRSLAALWQELRWVIPNLQNRQRIRTVFPRNKIWVTQWLTVERDGSLGNQLYCSTTDPNALFAALRRVEDELSDRCGAPLRLRVGRQGRSVLVTAIGPPVGDLANAAVIDRNVAWYADYMDRLRDAVLAHRQRIDEELDGEFGDDDPHEE
ncbi:MAG: hypothetical protein NZM40_05185 [Sphingomonadaceae bacterium]|uniref:hypothetical protein n=1 Tax=Thermaurantiacus sp. TaxID=2820283 RepID=UPI00298EE13D|nr:hypothetical protein [Thermaurantiacus sp.]MCS6986811.1 hypothetical protein [Sphingomonadaceae bacterium]MDW8413926.1 hypothetical protein [Thermaurantiacus sp.]